MVYMGDANRQARKGKFQSDYAVIYSNHCNVFYSRLIGDFNQQPMKKTKNF